MVENILQKRWLMKRGAKGWGNTKFSMCHIFILHEISFPNYVYYI